MLLAGEFTDEYWYNGTHIPRNASRVAEVGNFLIEDKSSGRVMHV